MPKVQITREMILSTALKLLIHDGHEKVNIKTVASELGCSTQPISWTFGNMEGFRIALTEYALEYANKKMYSDSKNPLEEYGKVGTTYIDMAFDEPNLIRFLRSDERILQSGGGFGHSFSEQTRRERQIAFAKQYGCTEKEAGQFMLDMLVYTQGLVSMIIVGGLNIDKDTAYGMLGDMANKLLKSIADR